MGRRRKISPDDSELEQLAGSAAFRRGKAYYDQGRVEYLLPTQGGFRAKVSGNFSYSVAVRTEKDFEYDCSCPVGRDGEFCKHLVAACLAWSAQPKQPGTDPVTRIREWLRQQDASWLAETLTEQACDNPQLLNRLLLLVAQSGGVDQLREAIDRATKTRGFVEYDEAGAFAAGIMDMLDALEAAAHKQPEEVAQLCLHALDRIRRSLDNVDDSDGYVGACLERIGKLHLGACMLSKPEPKAFARKLLELELASEYGEFYDALESYAEVLGAKGVEEYKRAAREAWDALPARAAAPRPAKGARTELVRLDRDEIEEAARRRTLKRILANIAHRAGDFEALLEVLSRDLPGTDAYIELIGACREYERYNEALDWARQGVRAFEEYRYVGLEQLLAEELHRAGEHGEAVELVWRQFTDRPSNDLLKELIAYAPPREQERWRDKAVGHLRKSMANASDWEAMAIRTLLVQLFLSEGKLELAVQEADSGKCNWETLGKLAEACAAVRPEDAYRLCMRMVPEILHSTTGAYNTPNDSYRQAAELIKRAHQLAGRLDRKDKFQAWYTGIQTEYKRKRNFMKLLDKLHLE